MKERLSLIPTALQHQLMIQVVLILLNIFLAFITLFAFSAAVSIPFLMVSLLLAGSIIRLYLIGVQGHYLILHGVILKVERTPIRQRPKALLLEAEGKALRLVLQNRHISPSEGHTVVLYLGQIPHPFTSAAASTSCTPIWPWLCRSRIPKDKMMI